MSTKITGFILRCEDRKRTAEFYAKLGLITNEHQHGGPLHFEVGPFAENPVAELYTKSTRFPKDAVMLEVDSIAAALAVAEEFGIEPKPEHGVFQGFFFYYITDPDGRDVMLIEKEKSEKK